MALEAVGREDLPEDIKIIVSKIVASFENASGHFIRPETRNLLEHTYTMLRNIENIMDCVGRDYDDDSWIDEACEALRWNAKALAASMRQVLCIVEGVSEKSLKGYEGLN